jgi:hypothetical protein
MAANPLNDPKWAENMTDTIVSTVDKVRDRTTKPIVMAARGVVFGLLAAFLGLFIVIIALVGAHRGVINFLEWPLDHDTAVWVAYFALGGVLCLAGSVCMIKRQSQDGV